MILLEAGDFTMVSGGEGISQLLPVFGGAVLGFLVARAEAWRAKLALSRKIARNLSQETNRIRDEFGREVPTRFSATFEGQFQTPKIHPWMATLIPE